MPTENDAHYARRVRRLKFSAAAWALAATAFTTLWIVNEWQDHGALSSFGNGGNPGEWNPTLWAVGVGLFGLIPGIMALGVYFVRPGRPHRFRFHAAVWVFGMLVLTPLWALIEWQDNGAFQRWSDNSRPGDWEPWILYVAGIWAAAIVVLALWARFGPEVQARVRTAARRPVSHH